MTVLVSSPFYYVFGLLGLAWRGVAWRGVTWRGVAFIELAISYKRAAIIGPLAILRVFWLMRCL